MTAALSGAGGPTASDVVRADLEQILEAAEAEFAEIAGRRLLITGGAGFLGFYLVQAALAWNERCPTSDRIAVTVLDNSFNPEVLVRTHFGAISTGRRSAR